MNLKTTIKNLVLNEKSLLKVNDNVYTFYVDVNASKKDIMKSFEKLYGTKALSVNTVLLRRKMKVSRFTKAYKPYMISKRKKALIKVDKGFKIKHFEDIVSK